MSATIVLCVYTDYNPICQNYSIVSSPLLFSCHRYNVLVTKLMLSENFIFYRFILCACLVYERILACWWIASYPFHPREMFSSSDADLLRCI